MRLSRLRTFEPAADRSQDLEDLVELLPAEADREVVHPGDLTLVGLLERGEPLFSHLRELGSAVTRVRSQDQELVRVERVHGPLHTLSP